MNVPVVQCRATSRTGKQCKNKAIPGGTVCRFHGGASPHVASKAAVRAEVMAWGLGEAHDDPGEVLLRLVTQSRKRADLYAHLLQEAFEAAERLKQAHEAGQDIEAPGDELADTAETARRDLDRIFNTGWLPSWATRTEPQKTSGSGRPRGERARAVRQLRSQGDRCRPQRTHGATGGAAR
jgi:hypothetical protein